MNFRPFTSGNPRAPNHLNASIRSSGEGAASVRSSPEGALVSFRGPTRGSRIIPRAITAKRNPNSERADGFLMADAPPEHTPAVVNVMRHDAHFEPFPGFSSLMRTL